MNEITALEYKRKLDKRYKAKDAAILIYKTKDGVKQYVGLDRTWQTDRRNARVNLYATDDVGPQIFLTLTTSGMHLELEELTEEELEMYSDQLWARANAAVADAAIADSRKEAKGGRNDKTC